MAVSDYAIVEGEYIHLETFKTKPYISMHIQFPVERMPEIVNKFGSHNIGESKWVSVALLNTEKIEKPQQDNLLQAAAMLCKEKQFHEFLCVQGDDEARRVLCEGCGIEQRRELKDNEEARRKFKVLLGEYQEYKRFGR